MRQWARMHVRRFRAAQAAHPPSSQLKKALTVVQQALQLRGRRHHRVFDRVQIKVHKRDLRQVDAAEQAADRRQLVRHVLLDGWKDEKEGGGGSEDRYNGAMRSKDSTARSASAGARLTQASTRPEAMSMPATSRSSAAVSSALHSAVPLAPGSSSFPLLSVRFE